MRWSPIPYLDGYTDPNGTISSPFSGYGIPGPLRLAPSQPALVGEDLAPLGAAGPVPMGPGAPKQPLPPRTPRGPALPPQDQDGGSDGDDPEPTDYPTAMMRRVRLPRPGPTIYRPIRPSITSGATEMDGFGASMSQAQQDADFSVAPVQIDSQSMNAAMQQNASHISGYGGTLIASNNYGQTGSGVIYEQRASAPRAIADVIETLRQAGKQAGLDTAASISVREGVPVSEAALEVISTRGMGAVELKRRIAGLQAKYKVAQSRRQFSKAKTIKIRLEALKARLRDVQNGKLQAVADMKAVAGDSSRIPPWVTYAGLGLGVASLAIALLSLGKGKK